MGGIYFRYNGHDHDIIDSIFGKERRHREFKSTNFSKKEKQEEKEKDRERERERDRDQT
jgi:hypothetical protein